MSNTYTFQVVKRGTLRVKADSLEDAQHKLSTATIDGEPLGEYQLIHIEGAK